MKTDSKTSRYIITGLALSLIFSLSAASAPVYAARKEINLKKAKSVALKDAGLKASDITFVKTKLDNDDGKMVYDIEFYSGNVEYDYEIDAMSGKILSKDTDIENYTISQKNNKTQNMVKSDSSISLKKAKSIALKDTGLKTSEVTFVKAKLDNDDGKMVYDIEFYSGNVEYDYEIDAMSGEILSKDTDIENYTISQKNNKIQNMVKSDSSISLKKAKSIALKDAGLKTSEVSFIKTKLDNDDGKKVYDIEFYRGNVKYEYEIDAMSGEVLDKDTDM